LRRFDLRGPEVETSTGSTSTQAPVPVFSADGRGRRVDATALVPRGPQTRRTANSTAGRFRACATRFRAGAGCSFNAFHSWQSGRRSSWKDAMVHRPYPQQTFTVARPGWNTRLSHAQPRPSGSARGVDDQIKGAAPSAADPARL
jgi:hypothetical protein